MILAALTAFAGPLSQSNISATTVGLQYWQSTAIRDLDVPTSDLDILLGQRLRWTLIDKDNFALRARVQGRFTLSPGDDPLLKRYRVRQLGVSFLTSKWSLDVGRHPVFKGGPRLVDGVQFVVHPSKSLDIGLWGGLLPNLFSTRPTFERFGGGPVLALSFSRVQASIAGEFAVSPDGLDRVAVLLQARVSAARTIEVSGRADVEIIGQNGFRLSDAQAFARWAPHKALRFDVSYSLFSSFTYAKTRDLDPDLTRFAERYLIDDPRLPALLQDCLEPNTAHQVGGAIRFHPKTDGVSPLATVDGRFRFGPDSEIPALDGENVCVFDDINQLIRIHPTVGVTGLPVGGRLDVTADYNFYSIEGRSQMDAGLMLYWEPVDTGIFAIDTSYRLLLNGYDGAKNPFGYRSIDEPDKGALGHYADFFVDFVVPPIDLTFGGGLNVVAEPGDLAEDLGIGAFTRITKYFRKRKKKSKKD